MFTLDANIFIRDTDPNQPFHAECRSLLEVLEQRQIKVVVPNLLLAEVAATLSRTRRDAMRARITFASIAAFAHIQLVPLNDVLAEEAAEIAADRAIRGADAVYVAVARRYGCTLVSLDREQRERAAPLVRTLTPAEVLDELHNA